MRFLCKTPLVERFLHFHGYTLSVTCYSFMHHHTQFPGLIYMLCHECVYPNANSLEQENTERVRNICAAVSMNFFIFV